MKRFLQMLAIVTALSAAVALAATNSSSLTWTLSTTRVDGTTISGPITVNIYRGVGSGNEGATPYVTGLTGTTYTDSTGIVNGTTVCYQVTEVETATSLESARTNEACKTFPASPPSSPTGLTVK